MLIIGAKGFAKEILEILHLRKELGNLCFFDDVNDDVHGKLFGQFPILKTISEVQNYFENIDNRFSIGIGNPQLREKLFNKISTLGHLRAYSTPCKLVTTTEILVSVFSVFLKTSAVSQIWKSISGEVNPPQSKTLKFTLIRALI